MSLLRPIRTPAAGWPFVQLPGGSYKLYRRSGLYYELRVSAEFSCHLREPEVEQMRESGELVIEGPWPT